MGLSDFKTESTERTSEQGQKSKQSKSKTAGFYRCVWNGEESLEEGYEEIIIEDKDRWVQIVEFIDENFDIGEEELESLPHDERFHLIRETQKKLFYSVESEFDVKKKCGVCGRRFAFPDDWDFIEYSDEVFCPDHTIQEVNDYLRGQKRDGS